MNDNKTSGATKKNKIPIDNNRIKAFCSDVTDYYKKNKRYLIWRENINPYNVLVSEIMLQQTQVERVIPKFEFFCHVFPDFTSLADASDANVLKAWQGLGYNRRALYLKKCARTIVEKFNSILPDTLESLMELPGIGYTTAQAILAYVFNKPVIFIETNIRTVFIHHFFHDDKNIGDSDLIPYIEAALDRKNPREWYYALMDYGSMLKKNFGNKSTQSKVHKKQSKFDGSIRQIRGELIRYILHNDLQKNTVERLRNHIDSVVGHLADENNPKVKKALESLVKDLIVKEENGYYSISND